MRSPDYIADETCQPQFPTHRFRFRKTAALYC